MKDINNYIKTISQAFPIQQGKNIAFLRQLETKISKQEKDIDPESFQQIIDSFQILETKVTRHFDNLYSHLMNVSEKLKQQLSEQEKCENTIKDGQNSKS